MARNTLSTRNTRASNAPMFCTISGIRKSIKLEATIAMSARGTTGEKHVSMEAFSAKLGQKFAIKETNLQCSSWLDEKYKVLLQSCSAISY